MATARPSPTAYGFGPCAAQLRLEEVTLALALALYI
jgi:hypothetical protein